MDDKELEERLGLVKSLVSKALSDHVDIQRIFTDNTYYGSERFQKNFQTVKINVPMLFGNRSENQAISLQKLYPYSFLIVSSTTIKYLVIKNDPTISEDVFTKDEVLQCKVPTEIHRSLANLRGLDLIIVDKVYLTNTERRDIFSLYKPKLLILLGNCDDE